MNRLIKDVDKAITFILPSFWELFSGMNSNNRDPIKGTSNNDISIIYLFILNSFLLNEFEYHFHFLKIIKWFKLNILILNKKEFKIDYRTLF